MILTDKINVKISNNQIKYFKEKGYAVKGGNEILSIKVSDMPIGSGAKIKVKCDICGNESEVTINRYYINTKKLTTYYACSRKCAEQKTKNTNLDKYGVENVSNYQIVKDKKVETCLKNFGVEYPQQSKEILNKGKNTKFDRYGDENYSNCLKMIKTKRKNIIEKYNAVNYDGNFLTFKCEKEHLYKITFGLYYNRIKVKTDLCTICNPYKSNESPNEIKLYEFVKKICSEDIKLKDRTVLSGKELDIYIPAKKIAIEYNGLYWHNELNKENNYHLNKTEECEKNNIKLIHIYEDEWKYKEDIVKYRLMNIFLKNENKIGARKCDIRKVSVSDTIDFLENNHIQGYSASSINFGLYFNNELLSLMTFIKLRKKLNKNEDEYELLRFCNKLNTNVVGGASKLLNYFIKNYNPSLIMSYADRSWSHGDLYNKLGFEFVGKTQPNYYYVIDGIRHHRFNFRKDKLVKEGYDSNKTEHEIMLDRKIYRIYNSGNLKFIYKIKHIK